MFYVYANTEHVRFWIKDLEFPEPVNITGDFSHWITQHDLVRMALIDVNGEEITPELTDHVRMICDVSDLTLIFLLEFTSDTWCREFDRPNVIFVLPGRLNWQLQHAQHVPTYQGFFFDMRNFYEPRQHWLDRLQPIQHRQLWFDALLGRKKWHRDIIYADLDPRQNIVTYFADQEDSDINQRDASQFIWPQDVVPRPDHAVNFTMQMIELDGESFSLSMIVPIDIYNQTRYSIVAETVNDNDWSFFTEKVAKPMLARRLFVVSSGQYYLRNLREMGFRTFDAVLDESYDEEPDSQRRLDMMLRQVHRLRELDPVSVYAAVSDVVEHNYHLLIDTDWEQKMTRGIERMILRFIEHHHKYSGEKEI